MLILLNGTSSSGKTTIARVLQEKYEDILLLYGVDTMVQIPFPPKCDFPPYNEQGIKVIDTGKDGQASLKLVLSPYMYPVYRSAVRFYKMLSEQGYNVIIDELLFDDNRIRHYFEILTGEKVYFIGIKPDKETVIKREKERGDRMPGLASGLYDEVYNPAFIYDLVIDSGKMTPDESADKILDYIKRNDNPRGFSVSAKNWIAKDD